MVSTSVAHLKIGQVMFLSLQYNVGRMPAQVWVLGILCEEYNPPRPIFQVVPNRAANTLVPIIRHHIKAGTTVVTDCWAAYRTLNQFFDHQTANHSRNFVDPISGRCKQLPTGTRTVLKIPVHVLYSRILSVILEIRHHNNSTDISTFRYTFVLGAHTNGIENEWRHAKRYINTNNRIHDEVDVQAKLYCYMWYKWMAQPYPGGPFARILQDMSVAYKL